MLSRTRAHASHPLNGIVGGGMLWCALALLVSQPPQPCLGYARRKKPPRTQPPTRHPLKRGEDALAPTRPDNPRDARPRGDARGREGNARARPSGEARAARAAVAGGRRVARGARASCGLLKFHQLIRRPPAIFYVQIVLGSDSRSALS